MGDLLHGIIKSCFFGGIIALIACWNGMRTHGGTEGVGRATTTTVVYTSITLLVSDFILSSFLMAIYA
jgi:phospholipid/cholesterol/gamma-HCH transport system permease protein